VLFIGLGIVGNLPGGILYAMGPKERQGECPAVAFDYHSGLQ
jgi:hypothetical protein